MTQYHADSPVVQACIKRLQQQLNHSNMEGHTWYDTTDEGVEADILLLRQAGAVAHHPLIHTLVRFQQ